MNELIYKEKLVKSILEKAKLIIQTNTKSNN